MIPEIFSFIRLKVELTRLYPKFTQQQIIILKSRQNFYSPAIFQSAFSTLIEQNGHQISAAEAKVEMQCFGGNSELLLRKLKCWLW